MTRVGFPARAWLLGARLDVRELERPEALALAPLVVPAGERGRVVLFRFGAAVCFDLTPDEERATLERLRARVASPFDDPELEEVEVVVDPQATERVDAEGRIVVNEPSVDRLQVVASALAKSTVLAHYEARVAEVFDRVDALAEQLRRGGPPARGRELLQEIGDVLLIQSRTVGRVEVAEKPEITWDDATLDRFYERLALEYELRERDRALHRKLEIVAGTAETYLDLLHTRQNLRLEWYIVILIVVEIVLLLYDMWG